LQKNLCQNPFVWVVLPEGSVLVDRESEVSRRQSFEEMKKVLSIGMHMSIYPEGTRNRSNETLKKFMMVLLH